MSLDAHLRFDEDTTSIALSQGQRILKSVPQKRAPIEVCCNLTGIASGSVRKNLAVHVSLSSYLHNVKELTHRRHRLIRQTEAALPIILSGKQDLSSGCPADRLPFQKTAELWEQQVLGVVSVWGL